MARAKKAELERALRKRIARICAALEREFPDARCALHYGTPEQLLFATILSAQCTDVRVNLTSPALFARYPGSRELAEADPAELEKLLRSVNFFRTKARSLIAASRMIREEFHGELPRTMAELVRLPGVGRKTANVVLGDAFGDPQGVVVDTHVKRLVNLLGLVNGADPEKIEARLMELLPRKLWTKFSHWLILHGRNTCIARRPKCRECVLAGDCESGRASGN